MAPSIHHLRMQKYACCFCEREQITIIIVLYIVYYDLLVCKHYNINSYIIIGVKILIIIKSMSSCNNYIVNEQLINYISIICLYYNVDNVMYHYDVHIIVQFLYSMQRLHKLA